MTRKTTTAWMGCVSKRRKLRTLDLFTLIRTHLKLEWRKLPYGTWKGLRTVRDSWQCLTGGNNSLSFKWPQREKRSGPPSLPSTARVALLTQTVIIPRITLPARKAPVKGPDAGEEKRSLLTESTNLYLRIPRHKRRLLPSSLYKSYHLALSVFFLEVIDRLAPFWRNPPWKQLVESLESRPPRMHPWVDRTRPAWILSNR